MQVVCSRASQSITGQAAIMMNVLPTKNVLRFSNIDVRTNSTPSPRKTSDVSRR